MVGMEFGNGKEVKDDQSQDLGELLKNRQEQLWGWIGDIDNICIYICKIYLYIRIKYNLFTGLIINDSKVKKKNKCL